MSEAELILQAMRGDWTASLKLLEIHSRRAALRARCEEIVALLPDPIADPDPEC